MANATQTKPSQSTAPASKTPPAGSITSDAPPAKASPTSLLPMKKVFTLDKEGKRLAPVEDNPATESSEGAAKATPEPASDGTDSSTEVVAGAITSAERSRFVELRKLIRTGMKEMNKRRMEVANYLLEVRDKLLYREHHDTFEQFCSAELNIQKAYGYELANAAAVLRDLQSAMADKSKLPANERQSRPLTRLKTPEQRVKAWTRALELAKDRKVTEGDVRKAVNEIQPPKKKSRLFPAVSLEASWSAQMLPKFKSMGFEPPFEQPIKWEFDAVSLYSDTSKRYLKLIDGLGITEASCVLALKQKAVNCLLIANGDANAPEGLSYSTGDAPYIEKESFPPAFHVMAKAFEVVLEVEGKFYRPGELDDSFQTDWVPVSYLDLELPEPTEESEDAPESEE